MIFIWSFSLKDQNNRFLFSINSEAQMKKNCKFAKELLVDTDL